MSSDSGSVRVAYLMSRFPKLTETFVLDEILELQRCGVTVEIFPLWRGDSGIVHSDARELVDRSRYVPTISIKIVLDNFRFLLSKPRLYLGTLLSLVSANSGSLRFLAGAVAAFPKACSYGMQMRELGVKHLHAHFASHPAAAAFVIGQMVGIPWSFTAHGSDLHREQSMLGIKVKNAAFVIAISDYNRRFILERVGVEPAEKVKVVHCGVRHEEFRPTSAGVGPVQLVCIGTLHAVKGQQYLLRACSLLQQRGVPFTCHLVGDGPDKAKLSVLARDLGIDSEVVFHGACERQRVRKILSSMHIAVAPSVPTDDGRREGIPVALMEAAACSLPLVASRLSGIPEICREGETGRLAEPGDPEGIADAIETISKDALLRQHLGNGARSLVEREFNLHANVERLACLMLPVVPI